MVQEEIKKTDPAELAVLTDAPCAVENIQRFAHHNGYDFTALESGDEWSITADCGMAWRCEPSLRQQVVPLADPNEVMGIYELEI